MRMQSKLFVAAVIAMVSLVASMAQAEQGVTSTTIKVGESLGVTGAMAELGRDFKSGAELYFNSVNKNGGVNGRRIELVTKDDGYDPAQALDNAIAFDKEGVFALFQFLGTGSVKEVSPFITKNKIPLVAAIATGPELRSKLSPYTFYIRPGNTDEYKGIMRSFATMGYSRVGIVYINEPFGQEGADAITNLLKEYKLAPVVTATLSKNGDGALAAAKQIAKVNPQAIILVTAPESTKSFITEFSKLSRYTQIFTPAVGLPPGLIKELGPIAQGIGVTQNMPNVRDDTIQIIKEYRTAAQRAGINEFTENMFEGFLNAKIFTEALRRAGSNPTRESLIKALESMSEYDAGGFAVHFSKTRHDASYVIDMAVVDRAGRLIY